MTSEDIKRLIESLPWQERCLLILNYHTEKGWSIRDSAKELNLSPALLVQEFKLARTLKTNPDKLKEAKSKTHALRLLDTNEATRVELRYAKRYMLGSIIKSIQIDGYDFFWIKLDKPLITDALDIEKLLLPIHHCKVLRDI